MKKRFAISLIIGIVVLGLQIFPVFADGIIIPDIPPCGGEVCPIEPFPIAQLQIKYHHVDVVIDEQIAVTHVDQVFYNPGENAVEGTYIFPLPADAVVTNFTLWVDGQPVEGKVLSADEARQIYEEIVTRRRDPALLEYVGRGAVQASIFPIPPHGERRIELRYTQVLTAENGLVRYVYPLNTEKFSTMPLESVRISVQIQSSQPVRAVYSPTHAVMVSRQGDGKAEASYEENNVLPDTDFAMYYSIGESQAFHLISYRDPSDPVDADGFFLMLLAPKPGETVRTISKEVILVLDQSGSMEGEKFQQAQAAAKYIVQHLNPEDYFGLVAFSNNIQSYSSGLRSAGEKDGALSWLDGLSALGSTDINRALLEAVSMASGERPAYLIFLTDGLPTEGETDSNRILNNLAGSAPKDVRLFSFGVGDDVDTFLLDSLAQEHHGRSTYVRPGEALDEILSAFFAGISTPVLTDLILNIPGLSTFDLYPNPLPDLFSGSQIVIIGRYHQGGVFDVTLEGVVNGEKQSFIYRGQNFTADSRLDSDQAAASIPRLWATRKIGYLLNHIRLNGADQETIDQIVRLSIRYGIVTPYTSYLVTEDMPLGSAAQESLAENTFHDIQSAPAEATSGQGAVDKAAAQGAMERSEAAVPLDQAARQRVRLIGARTFVLSNGVWVDTAFDPNEMQTQKVAFLSEDYFKLTRSLPETSAAFALGERVIVVANGTAFEVVGANETTQPIEITSQPTPAATKTSPSGGGTVCASAFLPLMVLMGGWLWRKKGGLKKQGC